MFTKNKILILILSILFLSSCFSKKTEQVVENKELSQKTQTQTQTQTQNINNTWVLNTSNISSEQQKINLEKQKLEQEKLAKQQALQEAKNKKIAEFANLDEYWIYDFDCKKYTDIEVKTECFAKKIEWDIFDMFKWLKREDYPKFDCKAKYSAASWPTQEAKLPNYQKRCQEIVDRYKTIIATEQKSQTLKVTDCSKIVTDKYSKETAEIKADVLKTCQIGLVIKNNSTCDEITDATIKTECVKVKANIDTYKKQLEMQKDFNKYNNVYYPWMLNWDYVELMK